MDRIDSRLRCSTGRMLVLAAAGVCAAAAASASVTGVCPDGSMFIVQRPESVPCRDAKAVEPSDVPPMKPEYLPRPYGWEVFYRKNDPNNPYNLIQGQPIEPQAPVHPTQDDRNDPQLSREPSVNRASAPEQSNLQSASAPLAPSEQSEGEPALALVDTEVDDLAMIVELSQRRAPAFFADDGSRGRLQLARSLAFEARVRDYLSGTGRTNNGPVVLFVADADSGGSFYGNLTFVQNGMAFHPSSDDPYQLGVIRGRLGPLENGGSVLGYVVLPDRIDPSHPIDVYWNDRLLTAIFQP
ncbi:MAG: hypothetical protein JRF15_05020 [Deltaproteobacteria bacterium]|jgi:hypothetical protein|nr:hypothetical protein [Deltaproteobacteria bacterium]